MKRKGYVFLGLMWTLFSLSTMAQDSTYQMKGNDKEITIDFLGSYYQQDGNNAAVTGGIGTEFLTDIAGVVVINVPLDSVNSISLTGGGDYYSSASTDNINNNPSSASSQDIRVYGAVSYSRKNLRKGRTLGVKLGGSNEYDYTSMSAGLSYAKEFNKGNSEINLNAQVFQDFWRLYLPIELRNSTTFDNTRRNSYNFQATYAQVLNKRMQFSISGEAIYMEGLLSTPFHRVYFKEQAQAKVENLPNSRLKIPIGLRFNYFPTDGIVLRSYYRFYTDNWGVNAHTIGLETPLKVRSGLTLSPFYRYHTQNASDYFAPHKVHSLANEFYTSDYDLSALSSQKIGLGIKINPVYGLLRSKWKFKPIFKDKEIFMLKSLELRGAYYNRSTNFTAFIGSINLSFSFK